MVLCIFPAVERLLLLEMRQIKDSLHNQTSLLQSVLNKLDVEAEGPAELPDCIQLPMQSMKEVEEVEQQIKHADIAKRLVSTLVSVCCWTVLKKAKGCSRKKNCNAFNFQREGQVTFTKKIHWGRRGGVVSRSNFSKDCTLTKLKIQTLWWL